MGLIFSLFGLLGFYVYFILLGLVYLIGFLTLPIWGSTKSKGKCRELELKYLQDEYLKLKDEPVIYNPYMGLSSQHKIMFIVGIDTKKLELVSDTGISQRPSYFVKIRNNPQFNYLYIQWQEEEWMYHK